MSAGSGIRPALGPARRWLPLTAAVLLLAAGSAATVLSGSSGPLVAATALTLVLVLALQARSERRAALRDERMRAQLHKLTVQLAAENAAHRRAITTLLDQQPRTVGALTELADTAGLVRELHGELREQRRWTADHEATTAERRDDLREKVLRQRSRPEVGHP